MDGRRLRSICLLFALFAPLTSCSPEITLDEQEAAEDTLAIAGKRLSAIYSADALTTIAARGDRVLAVLTRSERKALSRGYLRFTLAADADVFVAVPRGFAPFWLDDQQFTLTDLSFPSEETDWTVYHKSFKAGRVGLGVNALDRRTPNHYRVYVGSKNGSSTPDHTPIVVGLKSNGWEMTTDDHDRPAALRSLTFLSKKTRHGDATLLARGRVWKTHVVSGQRPDQITVAYGLDPSTQLVWSWRTSPEVSRSVVRYRKRGTDLVLEIVGGVEPIRLREVLNDPVVLRHTVSAEGLEPGITYEYTIGDGTKPGTSRWLTVATPPRSGDVSFLYMGDPQCGLEGWGKLLATARKQRPDASALLIAGDLVDRGNERTNWDHFFLRAAGVFEQIPLMPCIGNHEYLDRGPWLYRSFFSLPANGPTGVPSDLVYSFEAGDAFVAVLDSTRAVCDPAEAKRQADWLDLKLSQTRRPWKLVMFHHPLYASHTSRESPSLRDAWVPVIDRHHVDLVLQGHDHAYLRTYPLKANQRVDSTRNGTIYVVSVSGDKFYDQDPRDYTEIGFTNVSTYQTIDIQSQQNRLIYRSFDANGRERDAFTIDKPEAARPLALSESD